MKPILQALLVADHIYEDRATGKKVIAGVFHRIVAQRNLPPRSGEVSREEANSQSSDEISSPSGPDGGRDENRPAERVVDVRHVVRAGSPYAYISLTEIQGSASMRLQCVDLSDGQIMFGTTIEVRAKSPLDTVEVVAPLPPLPAGRGDHLTIELLSDGELLGSMRIAVDRR